MALEMKHRSRSRTGQLTQQCLSSYGLHLVHNLPLIFRPPPMESVCINRLSHTLFYIPFLPNTTPRWAVVSKNRTVDQLSGKEDSSLTLVTARTTTYRTLTSHIPVHS